MYLKCPGALSDWGLGGADRPSRGSPTEAPAVTWQLLWELLGLLPASAAPSSAPVGTSEALGPLVKATSLVGLVPTDRDSPAWGAWTRRLEAQLRIPSCC